VLALVREARKEGNDGWIRDALIDRLAREQDPRLRRQCLLAISWAFPDKAPEVLARAMTSDPDRTVRRVAAYCLGNRGTEGQVDALLQVVKEDQGAPGHGRDLAMLAICSLGSIGGPRASRALREILNNPELSRGCREQVLSSLAMAGDPADLPILEDHLRSKKALLRASAASGLGHLGRKNRRRTDIVKRVAKLLREHMDDVDPSVRTSVANAMGWVGGAEDIPLLERLLADAHRGRVNYTEAGKLKEKVVYPVREQAQRAIKRIKARLAKEGKAAH